MPLSVYSAKGWRKSLLDVVREIARFYDIAISLIVLFPLAVLSFIPYISEMQTRLIFLRYDQRALLDTLGELSRALRVLRVNYIVLRCIGLHCRQDYPRAFAVRRFIKGSN